MDLSRGKRGKFHAFFPWKELYYKPYWVSWMHVTACFCKCLIFFFVWQTCFECDIFAGLAGAVFMASSHSYCILPATVEVWKAAVSVARVASMHLSICTHCDNMVCFSNWRWAPGHKCMVPTWVLNHHIPGWTGLCGKPFSQVCISYLRVKYFTFKSW